MNEREQHDYCTRKFIELANQLKEEEIAVPVVSAGLMAATGIYVTYANAGNSGVLEPSGVSKVVDTFRNNLEHIQKRKREEIDKAAAQNND